MNEIDEKARTLVDRGILNNAQAFVDLLEECKPELFLEMLFESGCEDQREVLQWFYVDPQLADFLREQGELVLNYDSVHGQIWGRTEYGQSIEYDSCIREIAESFCK